jgi:hypothetical protein
MYQGCQLTEDIRDFEYLVLREPLVVDSATYWPSDLPLNAGLENNGRCSWVGDPAPGSGPIPEAVAVDLPQDALHAMILDSVISSIREFSDPASALLSIVCKSSSWFRRVLRKAYIGMCERAPWAR